MNNNNQVATLPSVGTMGAMVVRGIGQFAKRNKVISGSYIFGILFILLIGSGTKLSVDQSRRYDAIMSTVDIHAEYQASSNYAEAMHVYRSTKGWFSCDHVCQRHKAHMEKQKAILDDVRREGYARMSDAKSVAGIFSEVGVGEVKESFWQYFSQGKSYAKRQTMWDAMFMGMRQMSRDEPFAEYIIKMIFQFLMNLTMGLVFAFFVFIFGLWSIVKSYQPNPLTAVIFFLGCACGAFAFISSFLFGIFGATAGGMYGMAKMVEGNMRIDQGGAGRRRNVQYHAHTH